MDFYEIRERINKNGSIEIFPNFIVSKSKDLMVKNGSFYAIWDKNTKLWSRDQFSVIDIIDRELYLYAEGVKKRSNNLVIVKSMRNFDSMSWRNFVTYMGSLPDNYETFDKNLVFIDTEVKQSDFVSKRLPYKFGGENPEAYHKLVSVLYDTTNLRKIEWAIGSIFKGDAKDIQKFLVLYGTAGTGKSTILNIIQKLFYGYYKMFDAKTLGQHNNQFALEMFRDNPLVAIQHDGDLSRIEDNSKLNSIISHEEIIINEKYKQPYTSKINSFLFMGTNKPVKITDAKSGIIRRLIDVHPTGERIPINEYNRLMSQMDFELGGIAQHCVSVYEKLGKDYYNDYKPVSMISETNPLFNFVDEFYLQFEKNDGVSLKRAWELYNTYMSESGFNNKMNKMLFKEELKEYFDEYHDRKRIDEGNQRSYYSGFKKEKFKESTLTINSQKLLHLESTDSLFDREFSDCKAQYATKDGKPSLKWDQVNTLLKDIDTAKPHYVLVPENHIIVDFDLKDVDGAKSLQKNLEAASIFPETYTEISYSGKGVHLHYNYEGDVNKLSNIYSPDIEIKVYKGKSALRRMFTKSNNKPIKTISSGLPLKKETNMGEFKGLITDKAIRKRIISNIKKEYHPATKPSIDFIYKILEDAYNSGVEYDVTDLRPTVLQFAMGSTNNKEYCVKLVNKMKFSAENLTTQKDVNEEKPIVFYDVEVFPNLLVVCWKILGEGKTVNKMFNPTPEEIENLLEYRLIGFNNRRYDNHILYGRMLGLSNEDLYSVSSRIINNSRNGTYSQAYGISYADIYDFSSKKQSLKKFQIELGIRHKELGIPWDSPVDERLWDTVADYCANDVLATEAVFINRKEDFIAREILSKISGLRINDTTQNHTAKIIFGSDINYKDAFIYTDLSEEFPGYSFDSGISKYKGEVVGEGGYVYAEPGIHENVALLDVVSMHPTSLIKLNLFGPYTSKFKDLLDARVAIKKKDFEKVSKIMGGVLKPYVENASDADALSYALKIVINIVYGLTSAKFDNPFVDPRNIDNIVAKRGALFMIDLKNAVKDMGYSVAHVKTDSIKIPNADNKIINFVKDFGYKYGYEFEHEDTYDRMCLVNDAVYVAKKTTGEWVATGAQFKHPYVFKRLFSKEDVGIFDIAETKTTKTSFYLNLNENLAEGEDNFVFVGKVGSFVPVEPGQNGGYLMREQDGKMYAATGTKPYRWMETEVVMNNKDIRPDWSYGENLVSDAISKINKFGNFYDFVRT